MLSFTLNPPQPTTTFLHSPFLSPLPLHSHHKPTIKPRRKPISAALIPANPPPQPKFYQPFRPPPSQSPIPPQFIDLDTSARLDVLTNRLGLWHEYATLITPLFQDPDLDPTKLEEITGISCAEQNRLVVGAQVRESLVQSGVDAETLEFYDKGSGPELLYEIRPLAVNQRAAVAKFMVENKCEPDDANELTRAIKDFPRRRGDSGWDCFDYTIPGDCLAFMYYRQGVEQRDLEVRVALLEKALSVAVSDAGRAWVAEELKQYEVAEED